MVCHLWWKEGRYPSEVPVGLDQRLYAEMMEGNKVENEVVVDCNSAGYLECSGLRVQSESS